MRTIPCAHSVSLAAQGRSTIARPLRRETSCAIRPTTSGTGRGAPRDSSNVPVVERNIVRAHGPCSRSALERSPVLDRLDAGVLVETAAERQRSSDLNAGLVTWRSRH